MAKINTTKSTSLKLPTSPEGYDRRDQDLTRRLIESAFATFSLGIQQSSGGDVKVGDPGVTFGLAEIDFGSYPGSSDATVAVTGQTLIKAATSITLAWVYPKDTTDHTADEHVADGPVVLAGSVVDGVGFTIYGRQRDDVASLDVPMNMPGLNEARWGIGAGGALFTGLAQSPAGGVTPTLDWYGSVAGRIVVQDNNRVYGKWTVAWAWR